MAGYFDDSSMLRRVHRERALALSGPRALLMQAAHPLAVSGLLAHSTSVEDPYERLARTAQVMGTIGFGERAEANRVTRTVRAMHKRVSGTLRSQVGPYPAGTRYHADDPELLMWVLFTLVDSGLVVYRTYVGSLSREEEADYWKDYRVVGRLSGLRAGDMPRTIADLDDYRRSMLEGDRLFVTDWARARRHARSCSSRPSRGWRSRCSRRSTSSPSPCCRTGSGANTASRRCHRPSCAGRWCARAAST